MSAPDWLEAVAALRPGGMRMADEPLVFLTIAERDRLVRIARGVRALAEKYDKMDERLPLDGHFDVFAAELRRVLGEEPPCTS